MSFDVTKFLALTAVIGSTAGACTVIQNAPNGDGAAGGTTGGDGGASAAAGAGGTSVTGGAGGEAGDNSGGAGGAPGPGACIAAGDLSDDGDPSLEGLCGEYYGTGDCAEEGVNPRYNACAAMLAMAEPRVAVAVSECIEGLAVIDHCDRDKITACATDLAGQACEKTSSVSVCAAIHESCNDLSEADCRGVLDLYQEATYDYLADCMDPSGEFFEEDFEGTCSERLWRCGALDLSVEE